MSQKQNTSKRARDMAPVLEHLLSMCEALDSISSTGKKGKKERIVSYNVGAYFEGSQAQWLLPIILAREEAFR
jgi:hypothetical protein